MNMLTNINPLANKCPDNKCYSSADKPQMVPNATYRFQYFDNQSSVVEGPIWVKATVTGMDELLNRVLVKDVHNLGPQQYSDTIEPKWDFFWFDRIQKDSIIPEGEFDRKPEPDTVFAKATSMFSSNAITDASVIATEYEINNAWISTLIKTINNIDLDLSRGTKDPDAKQILTHLSNAEVNAAPFIKYQKIIDELGLNSIESGIKIPINILEALSRLLKNPPKLNGKPVTESEIITSIRGFYDASKNGAKLLPSNQIIGLESGGRAKLLFTGNNITTFVNNKKPIEPINIPIKITGNLLIVGLVPSNKADKYYPVYLNENGAFTHFKSFRFGTRVLCQDRFEDGVIIFKEASFLCNTIDTRLSKRGMQKPTTAITAKIAPPMATVEAPTGGRKHFSRKNRKSKK